MCVIELSLGAGVFVLACSHPGVGARWACIRNSWQYTVEDVFQHFRILGDTNDAMSNLRSRNSTTNVQTG